MFTDPLTHLQAELTRLDLLLHRQILRLRASYQLSLDEFRGLYISDEQVDRLINQAANDEGSIPTVEVLTAQAEALHRTNTAQLGPDLPWQCLVHEFSLTSFEQDVLLLAVAPEIHLKYETLYAYLNNDVSRKWPTRDLALRLFATDTAPTTALRRYLLPEAPLFSHGLLQPVATTSEHPSWLAGGFALAPAVSHHLLGIPAADAHLASCITQITPTTDWTTVPLAPGLRAALCQVKNLFQPPQTGRAGPMLIFEGRYGAGRGLAAEALCRDLAIPLLRLDLAAARATAESLPELLRLLGFQQRLQGAGVYVEHGQELFKPEGQPLPEADYVVSQLAQLGGPVFLTCAPGTRWPELMQGRRHLVFSFGDPDYRERRRLWEMYVAQTGSIVEAPALEALANRFILTPGQIQDALLAAVDAQALVEGPSGSPEGNSVKVGRSRAIGRELFDEFSAVSPPSNSPSGEEDGLVSLPEGGIKERPSPTKTLAGEALFAAARAQSDQSLGKLALKVNPIHSWEDLVLPAATRRLVQEIAAAIKYRHVVYSDWGFERRIASGKGLKVLFAGASGTGKTMTAGVIARDLGLDLYKIDLSGVVSKYIGETEKNLDRIFRAAQASNAILFFDEADALFGKRSEVKDAHDRYANIEVSYLLQKMEEHEGAVILASNLSRNIDPAFARRMHYVVEFPLPDETHREQLWRGIFPSQTPLGEDVDFRFLAKQFSITGGDIKNVALNAAFLAAQDGQVVAMKQLIRAVARQMIKQGKVPSPTDFKKYHALIADGK